jgi:hypothetical protein
VNVFLLNEARQLFAERQFVESNILAREANQQPAWRDHLDLGEAKRFLESAEPLVWATEIAEAQRNLAAVSAGRALVVQAGDCAEDPAESTDVHVHRKVGLLRSLSGILSYDSDLPVVRLGRLGGQFAKPRSAATELHAGVELPAFCGHLVNAMRRSYSIMKFPRSVVTPDWALFFPALMCRGSAIAPMSPMALMWRYWLRWSIRSRARLGLRCRSRSSCRFVAGWIRTASRVG